MHKAISAVAALAAACASCAPVEDEAQAALPANISDERQCFFVNRINGYSDAPDPQGGGERLYVRTGVNERWLLETYGPCPDLDWAFSIALDTRSFTSLCTGHTAEVMVPRSMNGPADRCTARVLGKVIEP